jgi:hypothetical protein
MSKLSLVSLFLLLGSACSGGAESACFTSEDWIAQNTCGRLSGLGSLQADTVFLAEVQRQQSFWNVPSGVFVIDDCKGKNAFAFADKTEIGFGRSLFLSSFTSDGKNPLFDGMLAHEWGHRIQFDVLKSFPDPEDTRPGAATPYELESDAWSGFYLLRSKFYDIEKLTAYVDNLSAMMESDFSSPDFHGTAGERTTMALFGMDLAQRDIDSGVSSSYEQLHEEIWAEMERLSIIKVER